MSDPVSQTTGFYKWPQFDPCPVCGGVGVISHYLDGSPNECQRCGASGKVIARDERGHFLPWISVRENHHDL